ncbi:hypothetical protein ABFX02_05G115200 [Erythranthe guttata]
MDTISSSFTLKSSQSSNNPHNTLFSTFSPLKKLIPHTKKLPLKYHFITSSQKRPPLLATFFKSMDDFVCTFLDPPLRPSIDPKHVLSGNFAPVDELPPTACAVVEGSLPPCLLGGAYIRNGPNPRFAPCGPHHLFDGDGMLHVITFTSPDEPTFCSRYVKTYKYTVEQKTGHPIFPSVFSSFNGLAASILRGLLTVARVVTRQFDPVANGFGLASINVALIGGHLFALGESDLPYAMKVTPNGDVITLGRHDFFSDEPFSIMTAHPKMDPQTGEAFSFRYHVIPPFLTLFIIDPNGKKQRDVPIFSMKSTSLTHDLAVTRNYVVIPDIQLVMDFMEIAKGRPPARVDLDKVPRIGVIPKYAEDESELVWIEAHGLNVIHFSNAWEEDGGETIVMVAPNPTFVEHALDRLDLARPIIEKIVINVKAKTLVRHPLSNQVLDMGIINPTYAGKKNRYVYAGIVAQPMMLVGVVKIDLSAEDSVSGGGTVASRLYRPGCSGSELSFVPREPGNPAAEEDDGYLVTYVHDENTQESHFIVMDAKSPTLETVAAVKLPGRVPTGFHGLFIKESDLNKL